MADFDNGNIAGDLKVTGKILGTIYARSNNYLNPLLCSNPDRTDDASGDTWIYADSKGSDTNKWGIFHNQASNKIEFYGNHISKFQFNLSDGRFYSQEFRGNTNIDGTGEAIYTPAGIYSKGTNWLYGPIITNNNTINAGTGSITAGALTLSSDLTANAVRTANAQGIYIGDGARIFDIGFANTVALIGAQTPTEGWLVFGTGDTTAKLGRSGTGPLTYDGQRVLTHAYFVSSNCSNTQASGGDNITVNTIGYVAGISLFGQSDGAIYSQAHSADWQHQIYGDYRTGQLAVRGKSNNIWQAWRTVLDSSNYNSWAPTKTGEGASGTWSISVTGNSATATTLGNARTLWGQSFNGSGNVTGNLQDVGSLLISNTVAGTLAGISLYGNNIRANGMFSYGISFSGTSLGGTHGSITGDWSTYFTTSTPTATSTAVYGWIFRNTAVAGAAGNVASISGVTGDFYTNGKIVASGDITAFSDSRLKTKIEKIDKALEKISKLNGYLYEFKDKPGVLRTGLLAQEVIEVLPEAVTKNEDGFYSLAYGNLAGLIINALNELSEEVNKLKSKY